MSNLVQRMINNAVFFALLFSVSLNLSAQNQSVKLAPSITINTLFACDIPDQANLDIDVDSHINVPQVRGPQPLSTSATCFYQSAKIAPLYRLSAQRAPPLAAI